MIAMVFNDLSDFELERLTWISAIGRGLTVEEPRPEPGQVEQDRRAVAFFYATAWRSDGTFALDRLTDVQRQRLAFLEARLREEPTDAPEQAAHERR